MAEGLFRKASIDKVSSPEQLDLLMQVTSPAGWLALVTVAVMLTGVGVWSVFGSVPDLVDGSGTLFRGERLYDLKATIGGSVVTLDVRPGSTVTTGQVIARLRREETSPEELKAFNDKKQAIHQQIEADKSKLAANQVTIGDARSRSARFQAQLNTMQRQWQLQKQLVDQGIKAPKDLLAIERDMDSIRSSRDSASAEASQVEATSASVGAEIRDLESQIVSMEASLTSTAELKSPESGKVVEVIKSVGDKVAEGEPLVRIERNNIQADQLCGGDVHALIYVPASLAGKVHKGQFARVSPSDVKKEEYGFMFGKVEWVASYPASTADMSEKLKNDQLVKEFMAGGPVFETRVCLQRDPANKVNGFKWSTSQGPPRATDAGTTCTVSMVVDEKKPYTYVIPAVRKAVGM